MSEPIRHPERSEGSIQPTRHPERSEGSIPPPQGSLPRTPLTRLWRAIPAAWRTPLGVVAAIIALGWIVIALIAPLIVPFDPLTPDLSNRFQPPGGDHFLGTDDLGRDTFSRILSGARITIGLALLLVVLSMTIGSLLGTVAGFFGRWVDEVIMRVTDLVMAFPTVILAMVTTVALGGSLFNAVAAALIVSWPPYARVVRSMVLSLRGSDFVASGRLLGFSPVRSMRTDIVPNVAGPTLVMASLDIGTAALLLSGLSFLGLGAKPPTPDWGLMISDAVTNFDRWWMGVFPGLAIFSVVVSFNFLGDALRDHLDPGSDRA